ncbi:hypothetical protein [Engelhardtia mirabilis]|uniref:Uncharacterized protein n=1 Tax=Engelhardtia mirabilis TaxID=2528011 RepID=A0A518BH72_9BACT|nr:hypothetical protein Pla133_14010 [Planctomycetes bacterium Pla133]QDV00657.1 hypothetical protein Pla86_14000 [Planctomycetes bacterium Pla86]
MIVRLEVSASEKISARSQYEPNNYSVLVSVDQLSIEHPDELLGQADILFRRAKEAIDNAKRLDGLDGVPRQAVAVAATANGRSQPPNRVAAYNGAAGGTPRATDKQLQLIHRLAHSKRLDRDGLEELCLEATGHPSHELSKFDASRVITALQGGRDS